MKRLYHLLFIAAVAIQPLTNASAITRQQLIDYASSLKGLKGQSLKTALFNLMQPKTVLSYGSGTGCTWEGFYSTDRNPVTNECYNRYSSRKFYFTNGNTNRAISGMNIEHSFPKSWWGKDENNAYKDLYNLYPSDSKANGQKGNYPMDDVSGEDDYDIVGTGTHVSSKAWEPGRTFKGDFSRSYLYMAVTYGNLTFVKTGLLTMTNESYPGLKAWASALYISWSNNDKVDSLECARNNAVAAIQGNRNLFVDYPYLAEYVWGDSVNVAFNPETSLTTASDDNRYGTYSPSDNPDNPNPDTTAYYWVKYTQEQPESGKQYLIIAEYNDSWLAMKPLSSKQSYGYTKTETLTKTNDTITTSNADNAFVFEASGNGYNITDCNNRYYYNDNKYKTFSAQNSAPSSVWTISRNNDGTYLMTYGTHFVQYSPKFTSYGVYDSAQDGGVYPTLYVAVARATTGIQSISTSPNAASNATRDNAIYTLQGVRVINKGNLKPGLYIRGGRKFVVK